ncbi:hypothetical protein [Streptomyces sp. G1]|uniref:hypothetical protein n=1 Tax=Streptomyces sp. G1 TaxID=361572 RepID=UPI0027E54786|nr:hypothetical protein [Streptomyces sp. G1]
MLGFEVGCRGGGSGAGPGRRVLVGGFLRVGRVVGVGPVGAAGPRASGAAGALAVAEDGQQGPFHPPSDHLVADVLDERRESGHGLP